VFIPRARRRTSGADPGPAKNFGRQRRRSPTYLPEGSSNSPTSKADGQPRTSKKGRSTHPPKCRAQRARGGPPRTPDVAALLLEKFDERVVQGVLVIEVERRKIVLREYEVLVFRWKFEDRGLPYERR